ncbi:MAG: flagellar hook-associated protein FlgL [Candidatus Electryonea clarkiae]|nr:flagellar hook-associated protein FlgL [Candidatus Electryonea clarkiae]MDP8285185.1 flagellar hook-associated protein FlgL [Candidatus Electryonea clarkiae]
MRVTQKSSIDALLGHVNRIREDLYQSQQVINSGVEVEKPSDDPMRARKIMMLNDQISRRNRFTENISSTMTKLHHTESELQSAEDLLVEARTLAVQGSTGTLNSDDRATLAVRVDQILHEMASVANSRHGESYLFGGFNTREAPYQMIEDSVTGDVTQVQDLPTGMDGTTYTIIGENEKIPSNIPGTEIFQTGSPGEDGDVFQVLIDLRDALRNDNLEGIQNSLDKIDDSADRIRLSISKLGGIVRRLENVDNRMKDLNLDSEEHLSKIQDADIALWAKDYELHRVALQNAMQIGTQVITSSLIDFIR